MHSKSKNIVIVNVYRYRYNIRKMKKTTIWTIAIIMGFSFLALLYLQLNYIEEMAEMKKEQFDESVNRALYQASRNLELNETLRYLEKNVNETERRAYSRDTTITDE